MIERTIIVDSTDFLVEPFTKIVFDLSKAMIPYPCDEFPKGDRIFLEERSVEMFSIDEYLRYDIEHTKVWLLNYKTVFVFHTIIVSMES